MISLRAMTDTSILHYASIIMKFLTLCNILTKKLDTLHYSTKPNCTVYIVFSNRFIVTETRAFNNLQSQCLSYRLKHRKVCDI